MKKFIAMLVAMLLCVTAVFGLAACGDKGGDDNTPETETPKTAADAIDEIKTLYNNDDEETAVSYNLVGIVLGEFLVKWDLTVADEAKKDLVKIELVEVFEYEYENGEIKKDAEGNPIVKKDENDKPVYEYRYYTVIIPQLDAGEENEIAYTITATIEGDTVATNTAEFNRKAVHNHIFDTEATCDDPAKCACGETSGEALGCKDANNDYKCDRCEELVEPKANKETAPLSLENANKLGLLVKAGEYTTTKYYVKGTVAEVNADGTVLIKDANNKTFLIKNITLEGTDGKNFETKLYVGDEITVWGVIGAEGETAQMKDAWLSTHKHTHAFADATCQDPKTCACGETSGEALGCKDENNDFKCDVCGEIAGDGKGTDEEPYIIPEAGDYICNFAASWAPTWYTYTATVSGYVTVSTTYELGYIQVGTDPITAGSNGRIGSVNILVKAGQEVYIGVSDDMFSAATIPFTVAEEAVELKDIAFLAGSWTGTELNNWGGANQDYAFVINADGTGKGYYYTPAEGKTVFDITAIFYIGDDIIIKTVVTADWGITTNEFVFAYAEADGNKTLTCASALLESELVIAPYDGEVSFEAVALERELYEGYNDIGMANINFNYTATENGNLTLTVGAAIMGMVEMSYSINGGESVVLELESTVTLPLTAGDVLVISVKSEGYSSITTAWAADSVGGEEVDLSFLVGTWSGAEMTRFGSFYYTFVFNANGTGTCSYNMGTPETTSYFDIISVVCNGNTVVVTVIPATTGKAAEGEVEITFTYAEEDGNKVLYTELALNYGMLSLTPGAPEEEGGEEGGETPDDTAGTTQDNPVIIESLPFDVSFEGAFDVYYSYTADKDITLVIAFTSGSYVSNLPEGWVKDDAAFTYTVPLTNGQTVVMNLWSMKAEGTFAYTFTEVVNENTEPETPVDPEEPEEPVGPELSGSGTTADPYIITSLPTEVVYKEAFDYYFSYTTDKDVTIVIIYTDGVTINDLPSNAVKDMSAMTWTFTLKAGETVKMNIWTSRPTGDFRANITEGTPVVPEEPEQPGEGGEDGGETAAAVTYISEKHGSGRYLKFVINAEAGTLTIIRSDMTGNFGTGGSSTAEYSYVANGANSTATVISGQSCTIVFGDDGIPTAITWGTAQFINFTVEA